MGPNDNILKGMRMLVDWEGNHLFKAIGWAYIYIYLDISNRSEGIFAALSWSHFSGVSWEPWCYEPQATELNSSVYSTACLGQQ